MENVFIGFRQNNEFYGCKEYLADYKQWDKFDEIIRGFYENNSLHNIKKLLSMVLWEKPLEIDGENNGHFFSMLLKENSIKKYALYHQELENKMSGKKGTKSPLYSHLFFKKEEENIYATFKNYGTVFEQYQLEQTYILDLDRDILLIEDKKNNTQEVISRNIHNENN